MDEKFETKNIFLSNKKMEFEVSIEWNQDKFKIEMEEWKNYADFCAENYVYEFNTTFNAKLGLDPKSNTKVGICQDKTKLFLRE